MGSRPQCVNSYVYFLFQVKLINNKEDEEFNFDVSRWMSRDEDDQDICRELPFVYPGEDPLPGKHIVIFPMESLFSSWIIESILCHNS